MSEPGAPVRDAGTLLGMNTRAAWVIAGFYLCSEAALAITSSGDVDRVWPVLVALALTVLATATLIVARSDPLAPILTLALAISVPVCALLVLCELPVPPTSAAQLWPFGSGTVTATFLCVRGRAAAAWLAMTAMIGVSALWSARTGQGVGHGVEISIINLGPLFMATFFAYTIRPAAHEIFALREESTRRAGREAAAAAALAERRDQTRRVDRLVRPILETIAGPGPLDHEIRTECRLIEAHLRDSLRAPALDVAPVTAKARAARRRGVDVVLVDDHGLDGVTARVRARLVDVASAELERADAGSVSIRILPPRRSMLATIVVNHPVNGIRRVEVGHDAGLRTTSTGNDEEDRYPGER
ncbi:hypothetical protein [Nocardia aurea]|uniref:hypothetical protein n=1 Tax=Nocardia aurea TaxID=2144174 RepID=UPI0033B85714